jgi:hypothetical protein
MHCALLRAVGIRVHDGLESVNTMCRAIPSHQHQPPGLQSVEGEPATLRTCFWAAGGP